MAHIHTNPGEHDFTASAYIIRFDTVEPQLLLHIHKKHNKLMQPGGHVELKENVWQGVLHEVAEETGYEASQLQVFQPKNRLHTLSNSILHPLPAVLSTHPIPGETDHSHIDSAFAFATDTEPMNSLAADESQILRWVTLSELTMLIDEEIIPNAREICIYMMEVIAKDWERVPLSDFQA